MNYYQTKTWLLLNNSDFTEEFKRDVNRMVPVVDIMSKYNLSYHVYRVLLSELYGRPMPPCRCK